MCTALPLFAATFLRHRLSDADKYAVTVRRNLSHVSSASFGATVLCDLGRSTVERAEVSSRRSCPANARVLAYRSLGKRSGPTWPVFQTCNHAKIRIRIPTWFYTKWRSEP